MLNIKILLPNTKTLKQWKALKDNDKLKCISRRVTVELRSLITFYL